MISAIDKIIARAIDNAVTGCKEWPGAKTPDGYGVVKSNGKCEYVHRVAYTAWVGPIPAGYSIDHLCQNRSCTRPGHLEAVPVAENSRRVWTRKPGHVMQA